MSAQIQSWPHIPLTQLLKRTTEVIICFPPSATHPTPRSPILAQKSESLRDEMVPIVRLSLHRTPKRRDRKQKAQHRVIWAIVVGMQKVDWLGVSNDDHERSHQAGDNHSPSAL